VHCFNIFESRSLFFKHSWTCAPQKVFIYRKKVSFSYSVSQLTVPFFLKKHLGHLYRNLCTFWAELQPEAKGMIASKAEIFFWENAIFIDSYVGTIEILVPERACLRWSSKHFWEKKTLVKSMLISSLDKVIYYKGTFLQGSTTPLFTKQNRLERKIAVLQQPSSSTKISMVGT
jgi:hypothetical protein